MIADEIIDQILDKIDIVEIVSGYLPLKKSGQNFKARCPFHEEKTPSFMVSPSKQIYHCFGCGAGGNVISFLMKHERLEFMEALEMLASKTGIPLPRKSSLSDPQKSSFAEKLYAVNNLACDFYAENLTKESEKRAHRYLAERGIAEKTIKEFRVGFALDSWQGLGDYLKAKNIESDIMEKAGLVLVREDKTGSYDRFRNRIIFPIFDSRNRVLGFGGRVLDASLPKYINSPETHIYKKGQNLYGLNFSREYIRRLDYVVIVEGYFDLIMPYQHEIRNVVATLGTALTPEQVRLLKRFTKNAIIVYDPDKAGEAASLRGLDLLVEEDMNVRIAALPKGFDPDSFVRKEGKDGFMKILKESKDLFDYKLGILALKFRKTEPHGKSRIVEEMLPTLARIKNAVLKSGYLKKMSEELSVDEESIRTELKKVKPGFANLYPAPSEVENTKKCETSSLAEITLLAATLENTECVKAIRKELGFENFRNKSIAAIFEKIEELDKKGKKIVPSHLISHFADGSVEKIISEAISLNQSVHDRKRVMEDCFRHIKKGNLKQTLNDIQVKIREAESASDCNTVNRLIARYNELIKEMVR